MAPKNTTSSKANLQQLKVELSLAKAMPCKPEEVIGQSIDIFHKDPSMQ